MGVQENEKRAKSQGWLVSLATIVDGILDLVSSNPKKDKDSMHSFPKGKRKRTNLEKDSSRPLRQYYLDGNDAAIYQVVNNFFNACDTVFWENAQEGSYIKKTVGIQALFDVLKLSVKEIETGKGMSAASLSEDSFRELLEGAGHVNFASEHFQASGIGKSLIRNLILVGCGIEEIEAVGNEKQRGVIQLILRDSPKV